jgi:hypothetical protein
MNALSASSLLSRIFLIPPFSVPWFQKVCLLAYENFSLLLNLATSAVGLKEMVIDGQVTARKESQKPHWLERVYETLLLSQDHTREFFSTHGAFFLGSGIFGAIDALFHIGLFAALSQGLFVLACCLALRYYVSELQSASTQHQKSSAIFGILCSLGYILLIALTLAGAPTAILVAAGALSLACASIKFVMDICTVPT